MRTTFALLALLGAAILAAGCGGQGAPSRTAGTDSATTTTAPAAGGHAAGIVPGSWEDWCAEHGVPETQCTRCDPSLIPAFQAANDWDPEHGLPMSQCTIHDPNLKIVRPAKPEGK
jgi:hypothetical protein